ncbi:hypothetical protein [Acidisoma sp. C75]
MTTPDAPPGDGAGETIDALRARAAELEQQVQALTAQARNNLVLSELKAEALRAGMIDLDGLKLVDTSGLTITERGEVAGCSTLMDRFRRDKPWLFQPASTTTNAVPPPSQPPRTKLATEMTNEEYRAARAAILRRF